MTPKCRLISPWNPTFKCHGLGNFLPSRRLRKFTTSGPVPRGEARSSAVRLKGIFTIRVFLVFSRHFCGLDSELYVSIFFFRAFQLRTFVLLRGAIGPRRPPRPRSSSGNSSMHRTVCSCFCITVWAFELFIVEDDIIYVLIAVFALFIITRRVSSLSKLIGF
jgi:hypothetical protein